MAQIEVQIDGSCRGNGKNPDSPGGNAAIGVVIFKNGKRIGEFRRAIGQRSSNEAEYEALIHAILICWAGDLLAPVILSDSETVVNQVEGRWKCKSNSLKPLHASVKELRDAFPFHLQQVPRRMVAEADALAKSFIDELYDKGILNPGGT